MMKSRQIVGILGILCLSLSSFGQIQVETQKMSKGSDFASIEEVERPNFNDFFSEINPLEMTFKPTFVIDSVSWMQLDEEAILDLDLGDIEINEQSKYYGIGRYEYNGTTYYFVAMPHLYGWWNVTVMVCNETGEFTDGYTIASGMYDGGEEMTTYGWVEQVERSNELIFISRMHVFYQDPGGEEEIVDDLYDCEAFCVREGEFAPYNKGNVEIWNDRYVMDLDSE